MSGNDVGTRTNTHITLTAWGEDAAVGGELYVHQIRMTNFLEGMDGIYGCGGGLWSNLGEKVGACGEDAENCVNLHACLYIYQFSCGVFATIGVKAKTREEESSVGERLRKFPSTCRLAGACSPP